MKSVREKIALVAISTVVLTVIPVLGTLPANADAAFEDCMNGSTPIEGCHSIGTFNVGNPDYWPGVIYPNDQQERLRNNDDSFVYPGEYEKLDARCDELIDNGIAYPPPPSGELYSPHMNCMRMGAWALRKPYLKRVIERADVDILATQETNSVGVWKAWPTASDPSEIGEYRDQVTVMLNNSSGNFTRINTGYQGGNQLHYDADIYTLVSSGYYTERQAVTRRDPAFANFLLDDSSDNGERYPWAVLKRKTSSSTHPRNYVLVSSIHLPSSDIDPSNTARIPSAYRNYTKEALGTFYRRQLITGLTELIGRHACKSGSCGSSVTYENPDIPIAFMGDFNEMPGSEPNGSLSAEPTAPSKLVNFAGFEFSDPRWSTIGTGDLATKQTSSTSIRRETVRDSGRVIDYVLYKLPNGLVVNQVTEKSRGIGENPVTGQPTPDGSPTVHDHKASDHRMVRLALQLQAAT